MTCDSNPLHIRSQYPDSKAYIFYVEIRASGSYEDFYRKVEDDVQVTFIKGKVASVEEEPGTRNLIVVADDMINGHKVRVNVDMVVPATGMVPNTVDTKIHGLDVDYDELGPTAIWHYHRCGQPISGSGVITRGTPPKRECP